MATNSYRSDKSPTGSSEASPSLHEDLMTKYREILAQGEKKAEWARYVAEKIVSCVLIIASLVLPCFHMSGRHLPIIERIQGLVREIVGMTAAVRPLLNIMSPPISITVALSLGTWWFCGQGLRWLLSRVLLSIAIKMAGCVVPPPVSAIIDASFASVLPGVILNLAWTFVICSIVVLTFLLAPTVISRSRPLKRRD